SLSLLTRLSVCPLLHRSERPAPTVARSSAKPRPTPATGNPAGAGLRHLGLERGLRQRTRQHHQICARANMRYTGLQRSWQNATLRAPEARTLQNGWFSAGLLGPSHEALGRFG